MGKKVNSEFVTYFVGAFHAAWACCYGFCHIPFGAENLLEAFDGPTPAGFVFMFQVMGGYFIYDFVFVLYAERIEQGKPLAKLSWATLAIHHGACIFILPGMSVNGVGGSYVGTVIPFLE